MRKTVALLVNLGTPSAAERPAVRRYLRQFLTDPRVIELPRLPWRLLLEGVILPFRTPRTTHAYQAVFTAAGSPLATGTAALTDAVRAVAGMEGPLQIDYAMRYGEPSIERVISRWLDDGVDQLIIVPLYPQYSATTTASVADAVFATLGRRRCLPALTVLGDYHDDPRYIDALASSVQQHWQTHGRGDHLLLSFHGLPQRYCRAGDPYDRQCHATAELLVARLGLAQGDWTIAFQSRVGREPWLEPSTGDALQQLTAGGAKTIDVASPGFAVDCLETLEEIAIGYARDAAAAGSRLRYIAALNDSPVQARFLRARIDAAVRAFDVPSRPAA